MQANSNWQLEYQGRRYVIPASGLRIGRDRDNDVVIPDDQASRRHALLWQAQGALYVRDESSKNGTFVNDTRVSGAQRVAPGDRIRIGGALLYVRAMDGVAPAPGIRNARSTPIKRGMWLALAGGAGLAVLGFLCLFAALSSPGAAEATPTVLIADAFEASTATRVNPTETRATTFDKKQAALSVVEIESPLDDDDRAVYGSGSIIDVKGLILTNFHVVRDPDTGAKYNRRDEIYVGINSVTDRAPDRIFRARVVVTDQTLDVAILQLTATKDGGALPPNLALPALALGDSDGVEIGDRIQVIGFPGLGGNTVTLTEGIVSGFLENRSWIKTDTQIESGNSGGVALNAAGEIIGIPTEVLIDRKLGSKIGLVRPINLVKSVIQRAP